jgi:O-antigen/teichoic acid export membrane protein
VSDRATDEDDGLPRGPDAAAGGDPAAAADDGPGLPEEALSASQIRSRAASGVALLLGRGLIFRVLGLAGNLVLARLLTPRDFGLVAIGLTLVSVGQFLAGAGLGNALVTRPEAPTHAELRAITGLQLLITTVVAGIAATSAVLVSPAGTLTAFMMLALPLHAFRTPAMLLLQRRMAFGLSVRVEIVEIIVYLIWTIVAAGLGLGAWALATGVVARVAVGTLVATLVSPAGFLLPSLKFKLIRHILAFGVRFQATGVVQLSQDTLLTAGIAGISSLTTLGLWTFASRVLQVPFLLFEAMWSVSLPAFSRMLQAGDTESIRNLLERTTTTIAVGVAAILCPLVGSSPTLLPLLFGPSWTEVAYILPGAAVGLIVYGPMGISAYGYLVASGDASTPLRGALLAAVVRLTSTFALLPLVGTWALGIGWALSSLSEMPIVLRRIRKAIGANLLPRTVRPAVMAGAAGGAGWAVAEALGVNVVSAGASLAVSAGLFAALMLIGAGGDVRVTTRLLGGAYRSIRARSAA